VSHAEPSHPSRLPALDLLRAIGAAAVLATHVAFSTGAMFRPGVWGGVLARLDVGVAIFFVLSAFLLFRPLVEAAATGARTPDVRRYLLRRALRILPAYWLTLAGCALLLPSNAGVSGAELVRFATLTHIYVPSFMFGLVQVWSLATEFAFYLVLPLAAVLALGRRWRPVRTAVAVTAGGVLISAGWLVAMGVGLLDPDRTVNWLPTYAIWFGAGMGLATAHVALRTGTAPGRWRFLDEWGAAPGTCWVIAAALLALASTPIAGPRTLLATYSIVELGIRVVLFAGIATMILIPGAFGPPTRFKAAASAGPARWLGAVSYGLFLWHPFVLDMIYIVDDRPLFSGDVLGTFLMTIGGGLAIASVSYYLIERPILDLGSRRIAWRRKAGEPQSHDGQQPEALRARVVVPVIADEPKPAA
jgi:peptidoglycan/LPS O-acetylase OafA/YrhL